MAEPSSPDADTLSALVAFDRAATDFTEAAADLGVVTARMQMLMLDDAGRMLETLKAARRDGRT